MAGVYPGISTYHGYVATIENGDGTDSTTFQPPLTHLTDRTRWLKTQATGRGQQEFTTPGTTTWNAPTGCRDLRIVCVASGESGVAGGVGVGGAGGRAGEIVELQYPGAAPASLEVTVGQNARSSWVRVGSTTVLYAAGGGVQDTPADMTGSSLRSDQPNGAPGGAGGTNAQGSRGKTSSRGNGGAGGAVNVPGQPGLGYGAGGGGGRQASGSNSGGGGGGGGYGILPIAAAGSNSSGGQGAPGYVLLTWTVALNDL